MLCPSLSISISLCRPLGLPRAETIYIHNPSQELPVTLLSMFTSSRHFHMPSFHRRVSLCVCPSFTRTLPPSLTQPHPHSSNFFLQSLFCFPLLFLSVSLPCALSLSFSLSHTVFLCSLCSLFVYFSLLPPLSHVSPLGHQYSYLNSQTAIETHSISLLCLENKSSTTTLHHTLTTVHVTSLHITYSPTDSRLKLTHKSFSA